MSSKNFIIKNGLTIGSTEVINSSGIIQGTAVNEAIDDRLNSTLTAGSGISLAYDDANNSLTITGNVGDITGVNAGDGLTGTATSGDATLNVGAGTGITVNADDIAVNMAAFNTGDLSEGSNLYYTNDRADARITAVIDTDTAFGSASDTLVPSQLAVKTYVDAQVDTVDTLAELSGTTDNVTEGSSNLYFTNDRADARISNAILDEDNMATNSATQIPSQQSVKAYVDSQVASKDALSELSGTTDDVTEGSSNLYHTTTRVNSAFDTRLATKDTGNLSEGSNLYHTTERVQDVVGGQLVTNGSHTGISFSYDDANDGAVDATVSLASFDTDNLSEGSGNLYFTNTRADARVNAVLADTDSLSEGSSNLYFTNERVDDRVSALIVGGANITATYDDAAGTLTLAGAATYADSDARGAISVTDSGGDGSLAYNSSTGVITYTGPSASEVQAHITAGTGVSVSSGEVSIGQAVATNSNVTFNNATIDGNLTVNGATVTNSATNTTIEDALIELGSGNTGANSNDLGLILERGSTGDNGFIGFDESEDRFVVATTTATGSSTGALSLSEANFRANQISTSYASNSGGVARNIYQNTSAPTSGDGQVGDLWILYS